MDVQQSPTPFQLEVNGVPVLATPPAWQLHQLADLAAKQFVQRPGEIKHTQKTQDNQSFAYYNSRFAVPTTLYAVSREKDEVTAHLDFHESSQQPNRNVHLLVREFSMTKRFMAWKDNNKRQFSQIEFANFLEDRIRDLSNSDNAPTTQSGLLGAVLQFKASVNGVCNSATNLTNGDMEFTFSNSTTVTSMQLPSTLLLALDVYEFGRYWEIPARLKYRLKEGVLTFSYELIRIEEFLDEVFLAEVESLRQMIGSQTVFVLQD